MSVIYCYIYNNMADFEITLLLHRLKNSGKRRIIAISETTDIITAQSGLKFKPDITISEALINNNAEALIIPGGPINNEQNDILPLINIMHGQNKLIAAICFAPQFLGRAGILDNISYTTSCSEKHITELGVTNPFNRSNFVMRRVVQSGNIITAQGYAFVDFAAAVCDYLNIFASPQQREDMMGKFKLND